MSTTLNDEHWLNLITQCRSSGLTDRQWCIENGISLLLYLITPKSHVGGDESNELDIPVR